MSTCPWGSSRSTLARLLMVVIGIGLFVAACGGGNDDDGAAPAPAPTTSTSTTTSTTSPTTTTTEVLVLSDLTGLPVDEAILDRPVVAAKIASDRSAQPQHGLAVADIVIEELVESGISRFLAIFQSADSDPVGPVRSARTSELDLLPLFGRPIFVNSGGNAGTLRAFSSTDISVQAGHSSPFGSLYSRDVSRQSPNNLFTNTSVIRELAGGNATRPSRLFVFRTADDQRPALGQPVVGVDVSFGSTQVRWVWDSDLSAFLRWQDGRAHLASDGVQLSTQNVVVLDTRYGASSADPRSPEAITIGGGDAWVLTDGYVVAGRWERPTAGSRYVIRDADGREIALTPGQTWIELPRPGNVIFLETDPR